MDGNFAGGADIARRSVTIRERETSLDAELGDGGGGQIRIEKGGGGYRRAVENRSMPSLSSAQLATR